MDAELATHYFLRWQIDRHGTRFAARKTKSDPRPCAAQWRAQLELGCDRDRLLDWIERHQFTGVTPKASMALAQWLRGAWPATLCAEIPPARDVLRMQIHGTRPVTVITDPARVGQPVLARANAFEFLLHDLEHLYQFFHEPRLHTLQRGLFCVLDGALNAGVFDAYLTDAEFARSFDYLIGDMNTHPLHSLQFLRAQLVEFQLRKCDHDRAVPLPATARDEIARTLLALGSSSHFGFAAKQALHALAEGRADASDAAAIEAQLLDGPFISPNDASEFSYVLVNAQGL